MNEARARRAWLFLPALVAFLCHAPSLWHGFLSDDHLLILGNADVTEGAGLRSLLLSDWFGRPGQEGGVGYYRPVAKAALRLTYLAAGPSSAAFHLASVLAHVAATFLLTLLGTRLGGDAAGRSAALLFAVHPMTVQAVHSVNAVSDVLAAAFSFLSALAFWMWCERKGAGPLALAAVAALLAAGSKESALLLPLFLLAIGLFHRVPARRLAPGLAAPAAAVAAVYAVRVLATHARPLPNALAELGWGERLLCVLAALGTYPAPLFTGNAIIRLPQVPSSPLAPAVLAGAAVLGASAFLLWKTRVRSPAALAVFLSLTTLAPALAVWLLRIGMWKREIPMAERWLYAPAAGASLLLALLLARLPGRARWLGAAGVVLLYAGLTWQRTPAYASDEAYGAWRMPEYLAHPPRNPREDYLQRFSRALRAVERGDRSAALREFREIDARAPGLAPHILPLARLELELGDPAAAASLAARLLSREFATSAALQAQRDSFGDDTLPRIPRTPPLEVLGRALAAMGRPEDARAALEDAAREAPTAAEATRLRSLSQHLAAEEGKR